MLETVDIVLIFGLAAVITFVLTPLIRIIAIRTGGLAKPLPRSVHTQPIPQLGGLALFIGFCVSLLWYLGPDHEITRSALIGGGAIVVLGVIDDLVQLRPAIKLLGQIAVAALVVFMGVRIEWFNNPISGGMVYLEHWGIPLTILWIVAIVNAVNLIDGLDGLAAGITTIAATTLLFVALRSGLPPASIVLSAALAGSSLGFLPFNFNPAKIFMGDAGSMFLGFGLAIVSVEGLLKSATSITLAIPVLAMGLPIADTLVAIIRRIRNRQPLGQGDKNHLHHRLLAMGLSHRDAVLVLYIASGWLGIAAWALSAVGPLQGAMIVIFTVATFAFFIRRFGMVGREPNRKLKS